MKKTLSILLLPLIAFSLTACKQEVSDEDPQTVINKAWEHMADKNVEYEMGTIDFDGKINLAFEGSEGSVEGTAKVSFDTSDAADPKTAIELNMDADGSFEGSAGSVKLLGEIRNLEKKTYLFLEQLSLDTGDPNTDLMGNFVENLFKSQWILLPTELTGLEDEELLNAEDLINKEVAELTKKHNFFEVEKDLGDRKYELKINPDKFKAYLIELSKLSGEEPLTETDLAEIDQVFNELDYTFQVQIDKDYNLTWVKGNITAQDPEDSDEMIISFEGNIDDNKTDGKMNLEITGEEQGSMSLEFTAKHDDSRVSIKVPADAQELDLESLFGFGGAGLAPPGAIPGAGIPGGLEGLEGLEALEGFPQ